MSILGGTNDYNQREFPMTEDNFRAIQTMALECAGIKLTEHKKEMIYGRLSRRIRSLGLSNFDDYCQILQQEDHVEHNEFVNTITTNLTSFYREPHHFEFLKHTVLPWLRQNHKYDKRLRVWSAGCSSGEEPYTIASVMLKNMLLEGWDLKILATDLDSATLQKAKQGRYLSEKIDSLSIEYYHGLFGKKTKKQKRPAQETVKSSVKQLVHFKRLNLMESWPMKGPFDVIFCRNVVIYFDKETQRKLFDRFADILRPDGYLFIGHSESLSNVTDRFELVGKTTYQRCR